MINITSIAPQLPQQRDLKLVMTSKASRLDTSLVIDADKSHDTLDPRIFQPGQNTYTVYSAW